MRQGCEAFIYLKASDDGKALVITKMTEGHNHEVSQVLYSHHEKFQKASIIGAKIADLVSRSSNIHYHRKIEQLEFVFNAWLKGQELILHILGNLILIIFIKLDH